MPNLANFYGAVHKMADKAIEQAQEAYETVRSDPETETTTTFCGLARRSLVARRRKVTTFLFVPDKYSAEVKDALSALYDARAVLRFMTQYPTVPLQGSDSRNRCQRELSEIDQRIQTMRRLKLAMSAK